jgi:nitroreductase
MQNTEKSIINTRRSIRKYDPSKPVTKEQLDSLLEAAMLAPSARNMRPWEFIAVTKREVLDEIANGNPNAAMCKTATAAIIVVAVPQTELAIGYYPLDCGAATQNILLRAVELDLGACWCGIYPREERISVLRKLFEIPEPKIPFCVIAVGIPAEQPKQRGLFEPDRVTYID